MNLQNLAEILAEVDLDEKQKYLLQQFWKSTLINQTFVKNDLPNENVLLWKNGTTDGFNYFLKRISELFIDKHNSRPENWKESQTIDYWIKPVMDALGWSKVDTSQTFAPEFSITVDAQTKRGTQTLRPDLVYVKHPEEVDGLNDKKRKPEDKLLQARNDVILILEAKYWDRIQRYDNQDGIGGKDDIARTNVEQDSASNLSPSGQILNYLKVLHNDDPPRNSFGIVSDGKTWRLHRAWSSEGSYFEFDLGDLWEFIKGSIGEENSEDRSEVIFEALRYFYFFFSKECVFGDDTGPSELAKIFERSKKYVSEVEQDLRKRFIGAMTMCCNSLKTFSRSNSIDLDLIRNTSESFLFNLLFIRSCEAKGVFPDCSDYRRASISQIFDRIDGLHRFDPEKSCKINEGLLKRSFSSEFNFKNNGRELYDKILTLTNNIRSGGFGVKLANFNETIFEEEEAEYLKKGYISNIDIVKIIFQLGFTKPQEKVPGRRYQQIPYGSFSSKQLGSIYESFLEYDLDESKSHSEFVGKKWKIVPKSKIESVYHTTLPEAIAVKPGDLYFKPTPNAKNASGTFYTPHEVVEYMIKECLSEKVEKLENEEILDLKICDPAMGSGHFLVECLNIFAERYLKGCKKHVNVTMAEAKRKILDNCIFGIDYNARAVKLTKLTLWLESAHGNAKLKKLDGQIILSNSLLHSTNLKKSFPKVSKIGGFDLVVGNPPYGSDLDKETKEDLDLNMKKEFPDLNTNKYSTINPMALFLLKSQNLVKADGSVSLIISDTFNTILSFAEIRRYLVENRYLKSVQIAPLDTFYPLIVNTAIVTIGGEESYYDKIKVKDLSQYSHIEIEKGSNKTPYEILKAKDILRIGGNPIPIGVAKSIYNLMKKTSKNNTLGLGEIPKVGSYQGLATGYDPDYLAILRGADLTNLNIKTGIDSLRKIKKSQIITRKLSDDEIKNGVDDQVKHFVAFVKATRTSRYFYESPLYIDWSKASIEKMKTVKNKKGKVASRIQNKEKYFQPCLVSNGEEGILSTFFAEGSVPAVSTNIILSETEEFSTKFLCGLLNSSMASYIVSKVLNGSLKGMSSHVTPYDIRRLPYTKPNDLVVKKVENLVDDMVQWYKEKALEEPIELQQQLNDEIFQLYGIERKDRKLIDNFYFSTRERILKIKAEDFDNVA